MKLKEEGRGEERTLTGDLPCHAELGGDWGELQCHLQPPCFFTHTPGQLRAAPPSRLQLPHGLLNAFLLFAIVS